MGGSLQFLVADFDMPRKWHWRGIGTLDTMVPNVSSTDASLRNGEPARKWLNLRDPWDYRSS